MKNKYLILAAMAIVLGLFGISQSADVSNATKVNTFMSEGPQIFGNTQQTANLTMPTVTTAPDFSNWVPVFNAGVAAPVGTVLVASNVVNGICYVNTAAATTELTTVVGIAAEAIAASSKGWMIPRGGGYATVLATGTVTIGSILVTTTSAAGYATGDATPTTGSDFGTAITSNTASSGGVVIAVLH